LDFDQAVLDRRSTSMIADIRTSDTLAADTFNSRAVSHTLRPGFQWRPDAAGDDPRVPDLTDRTCGSAVLSDRSGHRLIDIDRGATIRRMAIQGASRTAKLLRYFDCRQIAKCEHRLRYPDLGLV
jgi:hypothetical protein